MLANATANETKDELWWSIYAWWSCVLVLKMMLLTWYTGQIRVREQINFYRQFLQACSTIFFFLIK
ncbi:uncharacterized protein LOC143895498 isoform X2 [Temnothorax americanus]|uniref:uncharacterized protein LOC143895498 isoform X2 n=1 Tax=Temnothorax americanus TaxID=1964332 RepID=UPI0040690286